jgi:hypothetical protein
MLTVPSSPPDFSSGGFSALTWRPLMREFFRELMLSDNRRSPERTFAFDAFIKPLVADKAPVETVCGNHSPYCAVDPSISSAFNKHVFTAAERTLIGKRRELYERFVLGMIRNAEPKVLPLADMMRPSPPPSTGNPVVIVETFKTEAARRAVIDNLPLEGRRRVLAIGSLTWMAWFAWAYDDVRIESGAPNDLRDPGNRVGVDRVRDMDDERRRAKGVAGKAIGGMIDLYDVTRLTSALTLTKAITGVQLSMKELFRLAGDNPGEESP